MNPFADIERREKIYFRIVCPIIYAIGIFSYLVLMHGCATGA